MPLALPSRLELLAWDDTDPNRPIALIDVACSAGTYIRALARDLGTAIGNAAYLGALVRTASGPFQVAAAITIERLREAAAAGSESLAALLQPIDAGLDALPEIIVGSPDVAALARGQFVRSSVAAATPAGPIRVRDETGRLVAIATASDGRLAPDKVLIGPGDA